MLQDLGVTSEGESEILDMWVSNNEGAKFWLSVMNNLKTRGVEDILIAAVDGLKVFTDVYQDTRGQSYLPHTRVLPLGAFVIEGSP